MTARFQSTCSVRSKTDNDRVLQRRFYHFNPLAPCGARLGGSGRAIGHSPNFNPLAPCGARPLMPSRNTWKYIFQSTCSVRSKTARQEQGISQRQLISIHLLRAEQDSPGSNVVRLREQFQSTCSVRSKTHTANTLANAAIISIHLLRAEQDCDVCWTPGKSILFQSTCSVRSKTGRSAQTVKHMLISIHLLRVEQDISLAWVFLEWRVK